jgi:sugar-specific transcriptional regulator TrmB
MDAVDLERLGLNRNEAKVYFGLLCLGRAPAAALVRKVGVHRNIIYDNLERLIEKGLVSFVEEDGRRIFMAQNPAAILDYLADEKARIDKRLDVAHALLPGISVLLKGREEAGGVQVFSGKLGLRKLLALILECPESWCIGISEESVSVLGETYWRNYNAKVRDRGIVEHFLINAEYADVSYFSENPSVRWRRLPAALSQNTEILLFDGKVAFFVYSASPTAILIADRSLFALFLSQFEYLWQQALPSEQVHT